MQISQVMLSYTQSDFVQIWWKEISQPVCSGRRGGLMVSALDSGTSAPGSSPGRGHCVVFLGKTLYSHSASLHPQSQTKVLGHEVSSPLPPLSMLIKRDIFQHWLGGMGDTSDTAQVSLLILSWVVWKRYARNFPMKITPVIVTASQYFRIWFQVNDVHFVSGNWRELFYFNLD